MKQTIGVHVKKLTDTSPLQNIKSSNPELATTEIAKKLGERWQKMTGYQSSSMTHTI
jgi:hypothetical protein